MIPAFKNRNWNWNAFQFYRKELDLELINCNSGKKIEMLHVKNEKLFHGAYLATFSMKLLFLKTFAVKNRRFLECTFSAWKVWN